MIRSGLHIMSVYLVIFAMGMAPVNLRGQNVLTKHFTTTDGLRSNTIYSLMQDKQGFLWFSSDAGVTRFDGKSFQNYSIADGLSDNEILTIKQDSKGRIWFLGFNGTVSYMLNETIYNEHTDTVLRHIKSHTCFVDLFEDNEKRLWFITQGTGLMLDGNHLVHSPQLHVPMYAIVSDLQNAQYIHSIEGNFVYKNGNMKRAPQFLKTKKNGGYTFAPNGNLLFVSTLGVVLQKDTTQQLIIPFDTLLHQSVQFGLELSSDGLLWLTTNYGIYCYEYNHPEKKPVVYLKDILASSVLEDGEGNMWIGTLSEGLFQIPAWARHVSIINDDLKRERTPAYAISNIGNRIYIGEKNGSLKEVYQHTITDIKAANNNSYGAEMNKMIRSGSSLWAASTDNLIHYNSATGKAHIVFCPLLKGPGIQKIAATKGFTEGKHAMYAARNYSIIQFPKECSGYLPDSMSRDGLKNVPGCYATYLLLASERIYTLYEDKAGTLWYGAKEGLFSITNKRTTGHAHENELLQLRINSISETEDSTLVLAIHGHGIVFYKNGKIISHISTQNGLNNDVCRKLYVHKNMIYVATPSGVAILNYVNNRVLQTLVLNEANVLPFNDVNDVYADDRYIFIATSKGLVKINQKVLNHIKNYTPLLRLREIAVNDRIINSDTENRFTYKQNNITIHFIGLHYQLPREVHYRYRLKEDQLWKYTDNNSIDFTYLPPGKYRFEVQTKSGGSKWSAGVAYAFEITPPFWNTYWFMLLTFLCLSGLVWLIIRYRLLVARKKLLEKQRIEKQITSLEQEALQSMMNPHFIFNVMNSIQHFINSNDKRLANIYLSNFAKLIRINLTISYKKYIPLEEELNYLSLYLSFEKLRFGNKLNYTLTVDPSIDTEDVHIAVMMIQPFLENAIEHGILPLADGGTVTLSISPHNETALHITVTDNGTGIDTRFLDGGYTGSNESHAINITTKRLHLIAKAAGQQINFTYQHLHPEAKNKGTVVSFLLPVSAQTM